MSTAKTIIPPAPSKAELAEELAACAVSRTGALMLAARYAGRRIDGPVSSRRKAIPRCDSQSPTCPPRAEG